MSDSKALSLSLTDFIQINAIVVDVAAKIAINTG